MRIRLGNRVGLAFVLSIDVDPQNRSGQQAQVLAVPFGVFLRAGVPGADIQVAIGTKRQHATPVQVGVLRNLKQSARGDPRVALQVGSGLPLDNDRGEKTSLIANVVVDVVFSVLEKLRVQGETHHPFELAGRRFGTEVGEQFFAPLALSLFEAPDFARLLFNDEEHILLTRHRNDPDGMVEFQPAIMQRHKPDGLFDGRYHLRHAGEARVWVGLFQRLEIRNQIGELRGRECFVKSGRHQRNCRALFLLDLFAPKDYHLAFCVQQFQPSVGAFLQNAGVNLAGPGRGHDRAKVGVNQSARFEQRLDQLFAPQFVANAAKVRPRAAFVSFENVAFFAASFIRREDRFAARGFSAGKRRLPIPGKRCLVRLVVVFLGKQSIAQADQQTTAKTCHETFSVHETIPENEFAAARVNTHGAF
jgi:hypothetical protein